ncbi:MAG: protein-S-isoprenylcysteine O-methyltransferase Ste14 [Flavobacteriales bacterium]|jgi:protein-S-isoprenylcysteine O-methyltransferase Ste14
MSYSQNTEKNLQKSEPYLKPWVTDRAWISGVFGAISLLLLAYIYGVNNSLNDGISIVGYTVSDTRIDSILLALACVSIIMLSVECLRLYLLNPKCFFKIDPLLKRRKYIVFIQKCILNYVLYLVMIWLVVQFFHTAGEYGFSRHAPYYQVWFRFLEIVLDLYLWVGLPYVLITRAVKSCSEADAFDYGRYFFRLCLILPSRFFGVSSRKNFSNIDKKITRGLMVKLFFTPLMTVFFADQFPHLVSNMDYLLSGLPEAIASGSYSHHRFNTDFFNISISFVFSIDVVIAWCGYVFSSRWVNNQTRSAEPSMLGWVVCLICYPPFQMILGLYYAAPGERQAIDLLSQQWIISICLILMVMSYCVYMISTVFFGVRFSNLTHRGIIRKGPYAIVRHPAYASKNFAWWCIMFPAVVFNAVNAGISLAVMQTLGLMIMSYVYYWRAITEERHLSFDPDYQDYCRNVRFRFIPGVL